MQHRVSQRKSLACRECTQKKRKCDKRVPCTRCTRLGLQCDREVVYLRRDINRNGSEIAFLEGLRSDLQGARPEKIERVVSELSKRIESLQHGQAAWDTRRHSPGPIDDVDGSRSQHEVQALIVPEASDKDALIVTALEHITWGRSYGNCYPHRRCACQYHRNWSELSSINSQSFEFARSTIASSISLPCRDMAEILVSFHLEHIVWHHNCLHSPTFLQQCQIFWTTGECDQLQWLALYCAVLATSMFCLQNSRKYQEQYRLDAVAYSPQDLFQTMTHVLYESNFLKHVSLYSIQAIVISTEVAHNLGLSQLNATLFSAAIRMAECLGLHKIDDNDPSPVNPQDTSGMWHEALEKEVGRRVWLQMVIQDHFAIPFTDSYGINPNHYSTSFPRNSNDSDLVAMPVDTPTVSTYTRVLGSIARLMPELADGMGTLKSRKPVREQYQHVLRMDQMMRQVVRDIPRFLLQQDPVLETQLPWLGIARQSLAITAAEKIIMIHRPFIFKSFQSVVYAHTRRTCVSAALTILREHQAISDSRELSLWTHTAFCITAALILSFEAICVGTRSPTDKSGSHIEIIRGARQRLAERVNDVLAQRGVLLIDAICPETESSSALPSTRTAIHKGNAAAISFEEIVAKLSTDWAILGLSTDSAALTNTLIQAQPMIEGESMPAFEDFDAWFNNMFLGT